MNAYLKVFFCIYFSEISSGRKDSTEVVRGHSVEANPKEVGFHEKLLTYFMFYT